VRLSNPFTSTCGLVLGLAMAVAGADTPQSDRYPAFSWDKVPLYMHIRKAAAFTPAELKFLGRFPLVTLERDGQSDVRIRRKGLHRSRQGD
jgi:hypothetical protein